jgi:uncharacterized protein YgfB (UPF0149 family)
MFQVTFPEIARVLETLSATIPAAEGHGCLCGALCTTTHYPLDRWLDEIVPDVADASEGDRRVLNLLFTDTLNALRGDQMEFEPLLPDDDATLERRAAALSQWCQGFLYGFGSGRPRTATDLPPNVEEILRDLTQIGRAAVDAGESGEEEEEAYTEVVEYVRAGVQLIHDELTEARNAESSADMHDDSQQNGGDDPRLN